LTTTQKSPEYVYSSGTDGIATVQHTDMNEAKTVTPSDAFQHGGLVQFTQLAHVRAEMRHARPLQALPGDHL